ncbi:MAG TPA: hypothetical protein VFC61_11530 [Blastocatellia bacterium]|nr:hypothetical protein [Blastocatellia bacterium]
MSAGVQLANPAVTQAETTDQQLEPFTDNLTLFELAPDERLRRTLSYISHLQAEVRTLREELARAERSSEQKDVLLRNALTREMTLRADLVKGIC